LAGAVTIPDLSSAPRRAEQGPAPGAVEAVVDAVLAEVPQLRKTLDKKVFELRPRLDWDKG
jgi:hypothetical protein